MSQRWCSGCAVSDLHSAPGLTTAPLRLLILDCDGVLIDSEPASNRLVAEECRAMGLAISDRAAMQRFAGKALHRIAAELALQDGIIMPVDWPRRMQGRLVAMLEHEAVCVEGAMEMIGIVMKLGLKMRVASNSSHEEMAVKFRRTGLDGILGGRVHSAGDVGRPKPWPELFLAAAAAEGVPPAACLVVEDSDTGLQAARAAGMACVLLRAGGTLPPSPGGTPPVRLIHHLESLGPILLASMAAPACS